MILAALLLAGCTGTEDALEAASVGLRGRVEIAGGLEALDVRLTVAPEDAPARGTRAAPVELAPDALAHTPLRRDAWALEVTLRERAPGSAAGRHVAVLEWNGDVRPEVALAQADWGGAPERAVVRFDVGPRLEPSSLYVLTVRALPPAMRGRTTQSINRGRAYRGCPCGVPRRETGLACGRAGGDTGPDDRLRPRIRKHETLK